jgi:hypothetical protein
VLVVYVGSVTVCHPFSSIVIVLLFDVQFAVIVLGHVFHVGILAGVNESNVYHAFVFVVHVGIIVLLVIVYVFGVQLSNVHPFHSYVIV